jgi:hypothetical protein
VSDKPDENAQEERAEELRREIDRLEEAEPDDAQEGRRPGESLREFSERRMREERERREP